MSEITASTVETVAWIAFDADGNRTGLSWDIEDTKFWKSRGWSVEPLATAKLTPGRQAEGVTSPREIDPEGFKKYAAPTTSPEPSAIFHATGLAGERLARITAPAPTDPFDGFDPGKWEQIVEDRGEQIAAAITSPEPETATCTLCSLEPSPGFYTGCMVKDGHAPEWRCDGKGNLTKPSPEPDAVRDIKEALQEAREHLVTAFDAPSMKQRINSALWSIKQAETHLASLSAPVAGAWQEPMRRIRDFPHNDTICEQAMSQIAREALPRKESQ